MEDKNVDYYGSEYLEHVALWRELSVFYKHIKSNQIHTTFEIDDKGRYSLPIRQSKIW